MDSVAEFARRLSQHVQHGGGITPRTVSRLAEQAHLRLGDAMGARPFPERCARCGRALSNPQYLGGRAYGPVCIHRIDTRRTHA